MGKQKLTLDTIERLTRAEMKNIMAGVASFDVFDYCKTGSPCEYGGNPFNIGITAIKNGDCACVSNSGSNWWIAPDDVC